MNPPENNNLQDDDFEYREEWLSAYMDDELTAEQRSVVEQRLASDRDARQTLEELQRVRGLVSQLPAWGGNTLNHTAFELGGKSLDSMSDVPPLMSTQEDNVQDRRESSAGISVLSDYHDELQSNENLENVHASDNGADDVDWDSDGFTSPEAGDTLGSASKPTAESIAQSNSPLTTAWLRPLAIAACLLLLVGGGAWLWTSNGGWMLAISGGNGRDSESAATKNAPQENSPASTTSDDISGQQAWAEAASDFPEGLAFDLDANENFSARRALAPPPLPNSMEPQEAELPESEALASSVPAAAVPFDVPALQAQAAQKTLAEAVPPAERMLPLQNDMLQADALQGNAEGALADATLGERDLLSRDGSNQTDLSAPRNREADMAAPAGAPMPPGGNEALASNEPPANQVRSSPAESSSAANDALAEKAQAKSRSATAGVVPDSPARAMSNAVELRSLPPANSPDAVATADENSLGMGRSAEELSRPTLSSKIEVQLAHSSGWSPTAIETALYRVAPLLHLPIQPHADPSMARNAAAIPVALVTPIPPTTQSPPLWDVLSQQSIALQEVTSGDAQVPTWQAPLGKAPSGKSSAVALFVLREEAAQILEGARQSGKLAADPVWITSGNNAAVASPKQQVVLLFVPQ